MAEQLRFWAGDSPDEPPACNDAPAEPLQPEATQDAPASSPIPEPPLHLITSGSIVRNLGEPWHRVRRILETRPDIRPVAYAGRTRLYTKHTIARVRHELKAIDARRAARTGGEPCD